MRDGGIVLLALGLYSCWHWQRTTEELVMGVRSAWWPAGVVTQSASLFFIGVSLGSQQESQDHEKAAAKTQA